MAIPNFHILEYVRQEPYRDQTLCEAWVVKDGHLEVPDRPGLGVDLQEAALFASPPRFRRGPRNAFMADGSVFDV
jgi:galactonate dehydratase